MQEMVVHGQGTGEEGGETSPPEETGVPVPGDSGDGDSAVPRGFSTRVGSARVPDPGRSIGEPFIRCYNCGVPGHLTQKCPRYGPYWPEPGKTRADYAELIQEIADKNADDIIREHQAHDPEDWIPENVAPAPGGE